MTTAEDQAKANKQLLSGASSRVRGLCMSIDEVGSAVINVGGGSVSMPFIIRPTVGWDVWALSIGSDWLCLGPVARSIMGTVKASPSLGMVSLTDDAGVDRVLPYATALDLGSGLSVGDRIRIDWPSQLVDAEPAAEGTVVVPVPPAGGGGETREETFIAKDSGSYLLGNTRWWSPNFICSDSNVGGYFYDGIGDTIPDTATILSVSVYLDVTGEDSGGAPTIGLHSFAAKNTPPMTVSSAVPISSGSGWKDLPTSFGDALKTDTARGVGTATGGYHIYSPARVNNSGALKIKWQTT